jgi:hypothetical protein
MIGVRLTFTFVVVGDVSGAIVASLSSYLVELGRRAVRTPNDHPGQAARRRHRKMGRFSANNATPAYIDTTAVAMNTLPLSEDPDLELPVPYPINLDLWIANDITEGEDHNM